jgi:hypothetical protein
MMGHVFQGANNAQKISIVICQEIVCVIHGSQVQTAIRFTVLLVAKPILYADGETIVIATKTTFCKMECALFLAIVQNISIAMRLQCVFATLGTMEPTAQTQYAQHRVRETQRADCQMCVFASQDST